MTTLKLGVDVEESGLGQAGLHGRNPLNFSVV
jgi:hypothetical protein